MKNQNSNSIMHKFTNKYALSKTVRFELKPIGKTLENLKLANPDFIQDHNIKNSYLILKPIFDLLHEEFITNSLENKESKQISYLNYYENYLQFINNKERDVKLKIKKILEIEEKKLRKMYDNIYKTQGEKLKKEVGNDKNNKPILKESGYKVLTEAGILKYIKNKIDDYAVMNLKTLTGKSVTKNELIKTLGSSNNIGIFEGFFTYFKGFNQNRENYYSTDDKSTAVVNRIITENLPKFCDNCIIFNSRKNDYEQILHFLKSKNIDTQDSSGNNINNIESKYFNINYYNYCLSQKEIEDYNKMIGNINYITNLYNQQIMKDSSYKKLSKFKELYKQIGCGKADLIFDLINNEDELKDVLKKVSIKGEAFFKNSEILINSILNLEDFNGVYWSDKALNTISSKYFSDWSSLKELLKNAKIFKYQDDDIKIPQTIELEDLFTIINNITDWQKAGVLFKDSIFINAETAEFIKNSSNKSDQNKYLEFKDIYETSIIKKEIIQSSKKPSEALLKMIFADFSLNKNIFENIKPVIVKMIDCKEDETIKKIKKWFDAILFSNQMLKYFKVKENKIRGNTLRSEISEPLNQILFIDNPTEHYDDVRNYLTKKPQDHIKKLKLNFSNSTLADGWDENKEKDNQCIILKDDNQKQYLVILNSSYSSIFDRKNVDIYYPDNSGWKKMVYKLVPGANKQLPKIFFSKKWRDSNCIPDDIEQIKNKETFKKGENFNKKDLYKLIDFYKVNLKNYPSKDNSLHKIFSFKFSDTDKYESIDQFYTEVDKQGYKLDFIPVNKNKLDQYVNEGKIYLFAIVSQDNNLANGKEKKSAKNLQTLYWNTVFDDIENKPKLNGGAEIFYRPALDKNKLKKAIKTDDQGREIEIKLKNGNSAIRNFRFSKEKFIFHCPITLNFCLKDKKINEQINQEIRLPENNKNIYFLGIDRGEKHLAYYSLINQEGKIFTQGSFNEINGQNYEEKLTKLAENRDEARKNWVTIGTIKDLKDGYISQVIRKIVDIAIYDNVQEKKLRNNPVFIVLEDLNIGFKRGRQKIEKQVYQKLELALAKKLNYLVDKSANNGEVGSVTKAIQLTPPVNNYGDMENRKQLGNMLYVKADYTSQIDPVTGWRKSIYLKSGSSENIKEQIKNCFTDIFYKNKDYCFKYEVDLLDSVNKKSNNKKIWELYSSINGVDLDRFHRERNNMGIWVSEKKPLNQILDILFTNFDKKRSLYEQLFIENIELTKVSEVLNKKNKSAWETLRFIINLIQQIRNTGEKEKDSDFILSPIRNAHGDHFDSRKQKNDLPNNGDANGAYNIAKKGIIVAEHIKRGFTKLYISDEEWTAWLLGKEIWEKWIEKNMATLVKK